MAFLLGGALLPGACFTASVAEAAPSASRNAQAVAAFETAAAHVILVDDATGSMLFDKAADAPFAPASMTKIMTAALVFEALASGAITEDTEFKVSEHAWRRGGGPSGGSAMFANLGSQVRVADLLRGMLVQAGNDAAIVLAEGMAGSETAFVTRMMDKARELGLSRTVFANASGLPDPAQTTTARDMARLSRYVIKTWPDQYRVFSEPDFAWNKIFQRNRNPLIAAVNGADGLQTGYTKDGGFSLAGSVVQNGQRLVFVMAGLGTAAERAAEAQKLVEWAYRTFETRQLFAEGAPIGVAKVFGGASSAATLVAHAPVSVLVRRGGGDKLSAQIIYTGPLSAPVAADVQAGRLVVLRDGAVALETPLFVATGVGQGGLPSRAFDGAMEIAGGWVRKALRRE